MSGLCRGHEMSEKIHDLGNGAWNIRGVQRLKGVLNIGTQCTLIERAPGRFIFLDSYSLNGEILDAVMTLTQGGRAVEAVLNVHPFHTLHCAQMARDFPGAAFYGSDRHAAKVPEVDWQPTRVESPKVAALFSELEFSLPEGINYISDNENVHAGSLLVYHRKSGTLHVDDTFNAPPVPGLIRRLFGLSRLSLHPMLDRAVKDHDGAVADFYSWAERIAERWSETRWLCAAHSQLVKFNEGAFSAALRRAIASKSETLTDKA